MNRNIAKNVVRSFIRVSESVEALDELKKMIRGSEHHHLMKSANGDVERLNVKNPKLDTVIKDCVGRYCSGKGRAEKQIYESVVRKCTENVSLVIEAKNTVMTFVDDESQVSIPLDTANGIVWELIQTIYE